MGACCAGSANMERAKGFRPAGAASGWAVVADDTGAVVAGGGSGAVVLAVVEDGWSVDAGTVADGFGTIVSGAAVVVAVAGDALVGTGVFEGALLMVWSVKLRWKATVPRLKPNSAEQRLCL